MSFVVEKESWHLRKEFTLGTLLTIIVYAVVVVTLVVKLDGRMTSIERTAINVERMAVAETRIAANKERTDSLEARTILALSEINNALRRIEDRMDNIARDKQ